MFVSYDIMRMCKDEYESYHIYNVLAKSPMINKKLRLVLEKVAKDELKHYMFWRNIVGECSSKVSIFKILFYRLALYLFGVTIIIKLLESKEIRASGVYKSIASKRADLAKEIEEIYRDEEAHENSFASNIDEDRIKYIGFITLGISDALIELTGIYAGSLGAFDNNISAGLTGLLAGIAASISMGIASYSQAKHESRLKPSLSALYTFISYISVVLFLALPYFIIDSLYIAFAIMITIAFVVIAYLSLYVSVLHNKKYYKELIESILLILGVSLLLYLIGRLLGDILGIKLAD